MKGNEPVAPILVRSKNYHWPGIDADPPYKYSRGANPTRAALEAALVENEASRTRLHAAAFGSGIAAEAAFFMTLSPGDRVLLCDEIYGGTYRLFDKVLKRFGIECDFADFNDADDVRSKITSKTRYFFVEPMSNPSLAVTDLQKVSYLSRESGIPFVVDGTFCPAPALKAFDYGAEAVIYSLSKYFSGHNDALGGAVLTGNSALYERLKLMQTTLGAVLSPDECYRIIQGIKSLPLRWKHVSQSASEVARRLSVHPGIKRVSYPGLPQHPHAAIAERQFVHGCGSVVAFELRGGRSKAAAFVDSIISDERVVFGESLASPETILSYPPIMSHRSLSAEQRLELGITDGFFRLSLGFGDPAVVIASIEKALES